MDSALYCISFRDDAHFVGIAMNTNEIETMRNKFRETIPSESFVSLVKPVSNGRRKIVKITHLMDELIPKCLCFYICPNKSIKAVFDLFEGNYTIAATDPQPKPNSFLTPSTPQVSPWNQTSQGTQVQGTQVQGTQGSLWNQPSQGTQGTQSSLWNQAFQPQVTTCNQGQQSDARFNFTSFGPGVSTPTLTSSSSSFGTSSVSNPFGTSSSSVNPSVSNPFGTSSSSVSNPFCTSSVNPSVSNPFSTSSVPTSTFGFRGSANENEGYSKQLTDGPCLWIVK